MHNSNQISLDSILGTLQVVSIFALSVFFLFSGTFG